MSTKTTAAPAVVESLVAEYRAADKAGKAALRKTLLAQRDAAVEDMNGVLAKSLKMTYEACLATSAPVKIEVDPSQILADRIATLRRALTMLTSGAEVPEGLDVPEGTVLPEGNADEDSARKIATAKITRSGVRREIAEVIRRAFEAAPEGATLKVSEIARLGAIEGYSPSQGAISNRIKDGSIEGLVYVEADASGPVRARLA